MGWYEQDEDRQIDLMAQDCVPCATSFRHTSGGLPTDHPQANELGNQGQEEEQEG